MDGNALQGKMHISQKAYLFEKKFLLNFSMLNLLFYASNISKCQIVWIVRVHVRKWPNRKCLSQSIISFRYTLNITEGPQNHLRIDEKGIVRATKVLDFEACRRISGTVIAEYNETARATTNFTLILTDINDNRWLNRFTCNQKRDLFKFWVMMIRLRKCSKLESRMSLTKEMPSSPRNL